MADIIEDGLNGDLWQFLSTLNKSFPLKDSSCPGISARSPQQVACGERDVQQ
jgi:hypothetical protein